MNALCRLENGRIRRSERTPSNLQLVVRVDATTTHNFWTGLSEGTIGGIFVATHHGAEVGSTMRVKLVIGDGRGEPIEAIGEVRRVIPYADGAVEAGIVLAFHAIAPTAMSRVRRFVANVRAPLFFDD